VGLSLILFVLSVPARYGELAEVSHRAFYCGTCCEHRRTRRRHLHVPLRRAQRPQR